ncbi:hypothetical protein ACFSO7_20635 [Bacillus sp. CGMCC 1.16607]|uniref:hypothetical protein n=1 Tax=Bacillus sp. CGMCC 1.16607 TaxID=3351842 RepID=UPI00363FF064
MRVLNYVKHFLDQHNITDLELSEECKEDSVASYNFSTQVLEINEDAFIKIANNIGLSIKDTVSVIVSHELGHYLDKDLEKLYHLKQTVFDRISDDIINIDFESVINEGTSYVLKAENNAWFLGERYVPNHLIDKYKEMRLETLEWQKAVTQNEISKYISLVIEREKIKKDL